MSGVAFVSLSQGKGKGCLTHGTQAHTHTLNSAATTMKSETFAVKLAPFCSAPLQSCSSVFVSQWAVFPLGTCGIPACKALEFTASCQWERENMTVFPQNWGQGGLLSYQLRLSLNLVPQGEQIWFSVCTDQNRSMDPRWICVRKQLKRAFWQKGSLWSASFSEVLVRNEHNYG